MLEDTKLLWASGVAGGTPETASEPSEMPYTIFCMIIGHDSTIPVSINETETVGDLKKAIKEEKKIELAACDADGLTQFRVGIEIA